MNEWMNEIWSNRGWFDVETGMIFSIKSLLMEWCYVRCTSLQWITRFKIAVTMTAPAHTMKHYLNQALFKVTWQGTMMSQWHAFEGSAIHKAWINASLLLVVVWTLKWALNALPQWLACMGPMVRRRGYLGFRPEQVTMTLCTFPPSLIHTYLPSYREKQKQKQKTGVLG